MPEDLMKLEIDFRLYNSYVLELYEYQDEEIRKHVEELLRDSLWDKIKSLKREDIDEIKISAYHWPI